jgi:hypothetical protein
LKSYDFSKIQSRRAIPGGATRLFHVGNAVECVVSCHANACGATMLFGRAIGNGATKKGYRMQIIFWGG